jgi:hypothetical protein
MARSTRTTWLKAVALVVALASLTINFGLIDLIDGCTGDADQERNQVLDAGWGLVFGVILPLGLLAQLRRPARRIAGIQQTVALALALAGGAGEAWRYFALAAGVAGVRAVLVALHPARATFLARGQHLDVVMLASHPWVGAHRQSALRSRQADGRSPVYLRRNQRREAKAMRGPGRSSAGRS